MTAGAIVSMVIVLGIVVGGFIGFLALAMRHEARHKADESEPER
jgi:hypothetical protein